MQPARSLLAKDLIPINLPRLQLCNGRVAAVRTAQPGTYAKTALGKVESIAHGAAHAIIRSPDQMRKIDAALQHQVFQQPTDGIVGQRGHNGRAQPKAAAQPARHVVLTAALPSLKAARGGDASLARVQAQHHLAQTHQIPAAFFFGPQHNFFSLFHCKNFPQTGYIRSRLHHRATTAPHATGVQRQGCKTRMLEPCRGGDKWYSKNKPWRYRLGVRT